MSGRAGIAGLTLLLTLPAWAPDAVRAQRLPERARAAMDEAAVERVEQVLERAEARGVPTDPLVVLALEGVAKGAPGEAVSRSVSGYADLLSRSGALLDGGSPTGARVAAADALRRGLDPDDVRRMARRAGEQAPAALVVLTDLRDLGLPVEHAFEIVSDALSADRRGDELLALSREIARAMEAGGSPAWAVAGGSASSPADFGAAAGVSIPSGPPVPPGSFPPPSGSIGAPGGEETS